MTRQLLARFIAQIGITDASVKLGTSPLTLLRIRDWGDAVPKEVAEWLAVWAEANPQGDHDPE